MKAKSSLMGMLCLINKLLKIKHILALVLVFFFIGTQESVAQTISRKDSLKKVNEDRKTKEIVESAAKLKIPKGGVVLGDSLPEAFWGLTLNVVNHPQANIIKDKNTVDLRDYKDKLLILDFWGPACSPCVASVSTLNEMQKHFKGEIAVIPILVFADSNNDKILAFAQEKYWNLPVSVGNRADTLMQNLFYTRKGWGQIWIKDGKLLAIPKNKMANIDVISRILTRRDVDIEMNDTYTYFDKRYIIEEKPSEKIEKE